MKAPATPHAVGLLPDNLSASQRSHRTSAQTKQTGVSAEARRLTGIIILGLVSDILRQNVCQASSKAQVKDTGQKHKSKTNVRNATQRRRHVTLPVMEASPASPGTHSALSASGGLPAVQSRSSRFARPSATSSRPNAAACGREKASGENQLASF